MIEEWLRHILEGLVDHPEDIVIDTKNDELGVLFTVTAHADDRGKLIGRKGDHVNALRVILRTYGYKQDVKASLKIVAD